MRVRRSKRVTIPDGLWVPYEDHAAVVAELKQVIERLANANAEAERLTSDARQD
jgi:hypothetical protein